MARAPVLAAGGIVLQREQPPLIAVVRLRKRDEWVLPKGKLDDGETARAAARREVLEETGHNVTVREFLGTLVYESGGRSKVVHYWSMEADGERSRELMRDVRAVDWLPLAAALERLSRGYERTFLENVGPLAVSGLSRRLKTRVGAAKKRRRSIVTREPSIEPAPNALPIDLPPPTLAAEQDSLAALNGVAIETQVAHEITAVVGDMDHGFPIATDDGRDDTVGVESARWSLARTLRGWLGRTV